MVADASKPFAPVVPEKASKPAPAVGSVRATLGKSDWEIEIVAPEGRRLTVVDFNRLRRAIEVETRVYLRNGRIEGHAATAAPAPQPEVAHA